MTFNDTTKIKDLGNIYKLTAILFFVCMLIGVGLSLRKPLWNDESFSQSENIEQFSYKELFLGQSKHEGNKCPLFYVMQKAFCQMVKYQFPFSWEQQWLLYDVKSQLLLRINPNFFISLSLALLFFYFSRFYSLWAGGYSVVVALSFFMVWFYWVDARPYALWFFLTVSQLLLFLNIITKGKENKAVVSYRLLTGVNILLSLTITLGLAQIVILSFLLWIIHDRSLRRHLFLTSIPVSICLFYYFITPKTLTKYYPLSDPGSLLYACVGKGWVSFFFIYTIVLIGYFFYKKMKSPENNFIGDQNTFSIGRVFLVLTGLMYFFAGIILAMLMSRIAPPQEAAHYIHERYFLFLVPVAIVSITIFSVEIFRFLKKNKWMRINIVILLGGLLIMGYLETYMRLVSKALY